MMTALLILVALVLVAGLAGMVTLAINGNLAAQIWWVCGGAESILKILAEVIPAILKGLSGSSD